MARHSPRRFPRAIERSNTIVCVIMPNAGELALPSERDRVRRADTEPDPARPAQAGPDAELPAEIRDRNWIPLADDPQFEPGLARLRTALDNDPEAAKARTHWPAKALGWNSERRDDSFLLRRPEVKAAERWLVAAPEHADPRVCPVHASVAR